MNYYQSLILSNLRFNRDNIDSILEELDDVFFPYVMNESNVEAIFITGELFDSENYQNLLHSGFHSKLFGFFQKLSDLAEQKNILVVLVYGNEKKLLEEIDFTSVIGYFYQIKSIHSIVTQTKITLPSSLDVNCIPYQDCVESNLDTSCDISLNFKSGIKLHSNMSSIRFIAHNSSLLQLTIISLKRKEHIL